MTHKTKLIFACFLLLISCKEEQYTLVGEKAGERDTCQLGSETLGHGDSALAYQSPEVLPGDTCVSEMRTCRDGELSGSYIYSSCVIAEAAYTNDCTGTLSEERNQARSSNLFVAAASQPQTIKTIGDGWDVTFHTSNPNYLFNVYHHQSAGAKALECWNRLDPDGGGPLKQADHCSSSYPFNFGLGSTNKSSAWMNSKEELWINGSDGRVACVDVSTITSPTICSGSPYTVSNSTGSTGNSASNSVMVGNHLYWINQSGTNLSCFNTDNRTSCINTSFNFSATSSGEIVPIGERLYLRVGSNSLKCFDNSTNGACAGWIDQTVPASGVLLPHMNTSAQYDGICTTGTCWYDNGTVIDNISNPFDAVGWNNSTSRSYGRMLVTTQGKAYMHDTLAGSQTNFRCFDYTTNAICSGFTDPALTSSYYNSLYTTTQDPFTNTCIWTNSDPRKIGVFSLNGGSDLSGCAFWSGCTLPD